MLPKPEGSVKQNLEAAAAARRTGGLLGLSLCLVIPSSGQVHKYLGLAGLAVYGVAVPMALLGVRRLWESPPSGWTERRATLLMTATCLAVLLAFAAVYPRASRVSPGRGSDRDEALDSAASDLVEGRYPYYSRTYLDRPITPLPGSILLALPFWFLGGSAIQNVFWVAALGWGTRRYLGDARLALLLLWTVLGTSPVVWQELLTGGDLLANAIYVCLLLLWIARAGTDAEAPAWKKAVAAAALGVGLSSRANYLLLLPPLFSMLGQNAGWRRAAAYIGLTCGAFAAVTLPFYAHDRAGFSPLRTLGMMQVHEPVPGDYSPVIAVASGLAALVFSLRSMARDGIVLLESCAVVQAFPVLCGTAVLLVRHGSLPYSFTDFGLSFLFFGVLAWWSRQR